MSALAKPAQKTIDVWPNMAPGETTSNTGRVEPGTDDIVRLTDVSRPQLEIFGADPHKTRPGVLICPGGGYEILAMDLEGTEVAKWLNTQGYVAAVLTYRVPGKRDAAYADIQRAMSLLRSQSPQFGINPRQLGVLGFSAGGHLAARLSTGYGAKSYAPVDSADAVSCRPDFTVLVYPAYLIDKSTGTPAPEVTPHEGMPPFFMVQTQDDPYLDIQDYSKALNQAHVETNTVVYPVGGHGYGLRAPASEAVHTWKDMAAAWLKVQTSVPIKTTTVTHQTP